MSTEQRSLAEYVVEIVERLDAGDPAAGRRLRRVVGHRRARIQVGVESVAVAFVAGHLLVVDAASCREPIDGEGATDRTTVVDLLDARTDVTECLLGGRMQVRGAWLDVADMFLAIEIVLDATPRVPALRRLAAAYRADAPPLEAAARRRGATRGAPLWSHAAVDDAELVLLSRLGLVTNGSRGSDG